MNLLRWAGLIVFVSLSVGCGVSTTPSMPTKSTTPNGTAATTEKEDEEATIRKALAKLSPEDRKLAEEQRFCAVSDESRLGSMGTPIKLTLKDKPVFLCCAGCKKAAERDPDKTLERVEALRSGKPSVPKGTEPEDKKPSGPTEP